MQEHSVVALPNPWSTLSDPLTEVLRRGAQQLVAQAVEAEVETLLSQYANQRDQQGRKAVCEMAIFPNVKSKPALAPCRCRFPGYAIEAAGVFGFTRRFYRLICGARKISKPCCRGSISRGFQRAIFPRPWKPS